MDRKILVILGICSTIIFAIGVMLLAAGIRSFSHMSLVVYKGRGMFVSYYYLFSGSLLLISSIGLALLKSWGRILTIISSIVIILFHLERFWYFRSLISVNKQNYTVNLSKSYTYCYSYLGIAVLFSLLVYFLLRPKIKEQFK